MDTTDDRVSYITNSVFTRNKSKQGGAIMVDRAEKLEISGNSFTLNRAETESADNANDLSGFGGAILYSCDPTRF